MNGSYDRLLFPLNVYATLMAWDFGIVDALHFGLFSETVRKLPQAQQEATELLLARLPERQAGKFLEVGTGLGVLLARLLSEGYDATGLNPDAIQVDIARQRYGLDEKRLIRLPFEQAELENNAYSCIVFQESAQYMDQVFLLQRSADLLVTGGRLVIMDEFMLHCSGREMRRLHYLPFFLEQASRCGLSLTKRKDLGASVLPTLEYLRSSLARHEKRIADELALDPDQLEYLARELDLYVEKYSRGCFGYALLCFEKSRSVPYRVFPARPSDQKNIRVLFEQVFGEQLDSARYAWKYARGHAMLAWHGNSVVGHYGGMERDILLCGRPDVAVQVGDVMVSPEHRLRKGPFWLTARAFAEKYVGDCAPFVLAFGFPNRRAMKLGRLLGLYTAVDKMVQLVLPVRKTSLPALSCKLRELDADSFQVLSPAIDCLWQRMAVFHRKNIIGIRDAEYLCRRYVEHPAGQYRIIARINRISGTLQSLFVLRSQGDDAYLLMDILGPPDEMMPTIRQAARVTGRSRRSRLLFWLTAGMADQFFPAGGRVEHEDLDIVIPMISCTPGLTPDEVRNRWWLTAGDMDFL